MTWRLGHLVFSRASGSIASFLFLLTPVFLRWSIESHPDLPQLFFLLCGLYYALRLYGEYDTRSLVLSCVFLLPLIVLCLLLAEDDVLRPSAAVRRLKTVGIWLLLLGVPVIFCVTVAITNPYRVLAFNAFRESLMMEKGIMGFGHSFRMETSGVEWLDMLWGLIGSVHGAVLLVTLTVCVLSVKREGHVPAAPGMLSCGWLYSLRI
ncbi:MAG: hypothetical protein CME25_00370 [Gemmatimonadetes bacterium]|nr:hypothetical protein [Gemmatimonadota bacterium]|tara:strand:- start:1019 stop:1639 length:621 start_codon:yes stop_codon:yes gene_type:complete